MRHYNGLFVFVLLASVLVFAPSAMAQCPAYMHVGLDGSCHNGTDPDRCWVCNPESAPSYKPVVTSKTISLETLKSPDGRPVFLPSEVKIYPFLGNTGYGYNFYNRGTSDLSAEQVWSAFVKAFQTGGHVRSGKRWLGAGYSYGGFYLFRPSESLNFREVKNPGSADVWLVRVIAKPIGQRTQSGVRGPSFLATAIGIGATVGAEKIAGSTAGDFGAAYLNQLAYSIFSYGEAVYVVRQQLNVDVEFENLGTGDTQVFSGQSQLTTVQMDRTVQNAYREVREMNQYSLNSAVAQAMSGARSEFNVRPRMIALPSQQTLATVVADNKDVRDSIEAERELKAALQEAARLKAELERIQIKPVPPEVKK